MIPVPLSPVLSLDASGEEGGRMFCVEMPNLQN